VRDSYYTLRQDVLASVSMMPNTSDGSWLITGVEVGRRGRGQGRAREVLELCLADADTEGVVLWLSCDPQEHTVDFERLKQWYEGYGFVFTGDDGVTMKREPQ